MATHGMVYEDLVDASGLDARTIRGIIHGDKQPHSKTIQRLAGAFDVSTDELFAAPTGHTSESFDAVTNPSVAEVASSHPHLFEDWTPSDFAELASRFGVGGALTPEGVISEAQALNDRRALLGRAKVVLESTDSSLLASLINLLFERATTQE